VSAANYCFELNLEVRDYECDLQGIVNHSVYLNYLEHARHQYLNSIGLDFAYLHRQGYSLVVTRCEVDYLASLKSGDRFVVKLEMVRQSRLRFAFLHDIYRHPDDEHVLRAKVIGTSLSTAGRPAFPAELEAVLA
jgi:acyl-CoA thioester hydrolase